VSLLGFVLLAIAVWAIWSRLSTLERRLRQIEQTLSVLKRGVAREAAPALMPATPVEAAAARQAPVPRVAQAGDMAAGGAAPAMMPSAPAAVPGSAPPSLQQPRNASSGAPRPPSIDDVIIRVVREYFTGGNLVVRVGIIVLFFGVGFLLKYVAQHAHLSIGTRLAGVSLGAMVLFVVGWRLRERRRGFSLALQGGAVGILYLTLFAALKFYQLLPAGITFAMMAGLGVALCLLAIRQDSLALSMLGAIGGFLAPVLASTGDGSHVVLFSYYALLNLFIVVQAWFKAWRPLNLLAFVFTFGVGAVWGVMRYEPAQFATTEPFLLYFFLAFIAIAVLFAHRTAPRLGHYVDGTLVFGTPVVAMTLQMALVRNFEHGRAWSAVGAGVVYLLLAAWLQHTQRDTLRLLKESFLALGVAFLTLAVPLWLDDSWTAATWALEGAALVWVGLRQARWLPTCSGLVLQLAAAVAYVLSQLLAPAALIPVVNAGCMGALFLCVAALCSARFAAQPGSLFSACGQWPANLLLAWGLGWWFYATGNEVLDFVPVMWRSGALLGLCAFTALVAGALVRPLSWPALRAPALLILPVMIAAAVVWAERRLHPLGEAGGLAWPAGFAALWLSLWWHEATLPDRMAAQLHGIALWLLGLLISWELHWQISQMAVPGTAWAGAVLGLAPTLLLVLLTGSMAERWWPLRNHRAEFRSWVACGLAAGLVGWSLWLNSVSDGSAAPAAYLPLLNPLDLAVGFAICAMALWLRVVWRAGAELYGRASQRLMLAVLVAAAFFWLNAVLLRTMHYWGGVTYRFDAMMASTAVQAALSIFWTLLALGAMLWANRGGWRVVWFGAAGLMAVVVAKLFVVDLVRVGTVPRIVSFLVVGGLMLVIGYYSPLPPARNEAASQG
jgi:uncharacterized membrane protein